MMMFSFVFFFLMLRRPPRSTRTDTLFPTRRSSDLDAEITRIQELHERMVRKYEAGALRDYFKLNEQIHQLILAAARNPTLAQMQLSLSGRVRRSEEHTSELQSLMRISYAVFCLKKKKRHNISSIHTYNRLTQ